MNQEVINLAGAEAAWLPGQIQDKLKSNLQEFLGMKTVVDSKSEAALKNSRRKAKAMPAMKVVQSSLEKSQPQSSHFLQNLEKLAAVM